MTELFNPHSLFCPLMMFSGAFNSRVIMVTAMHAMLGYGFDATLFKLCKIFLFWHYVVSDLCSEDQETLDDVLHKWTVILL